MEDPMDEFLPDYENAAPGDAQTVEDRQGFASNVSAEQINFNSGFTFGAAANQDMTMNQSMAVGVAAGRDMTAADSLLLSNAVGRDLSLKDSGAGVLTAGGSVNIEEGGAVVALAGRVTALKSNMGLVIGNYITMDEGSSVKVNMTMKQAVVFGAAFGAVFAVLNRLFRRK